jgi:hypothetical protein
MYKKGLSIICVQWSSSKKLSCFPSDFYMGGLKKWMLFGYGSHNNKTFEN